MANNEIENVDKVIRYNVRKILKNYSYTTLSRGDLYQLGYIGYMKAQKNYNPEYGKMTLKYATDFIWQEMLYNVIKTIKYESRMVNGPTEDLVDKSELNVTDDERLVKIAQILKELPERQADIVRSFYMSGKTLRLKDIAAKYGVSKQCIFQIKKRALETIKEKLSE